MSKLTLSVDPDVVERAKQYAAASGTSVSKLVEHYLALLVSDPQPLAEPPVLARWRGALVGVEVDVEGHRQHLVQKYLE